MILVFLAVRYGLDVFPGISPGAKFGIALCTVVPSRLYACYLFGNVTLGTPMSWSHTTKNAQSSEGSDSKTSVSANNISSILERVTEHQSVLLFGPDGLEWLWLVRGDRSYYIQLSLYPKRLEALRERFQAAVRKAGADVEEKYDDQGRIFACRLGSDPQTAGESAWAIFTETMLLERHAQVSMKWL